MVDLMQTAFNPLSDLFVTGAWDVSTFLTNSQKTLSEWFKGIIFILGAVAIFVAIWQITTGLMSQGRKQVNWGLSIILLIVGGALTAGGFGFVKDIAKGGKDTIEDLGEGSGKVSYVQPVDIEQEAPHLQDGFVV